MSYIQSPTELVNLDAIELRDLANFQSDVAELINSQEIVDEIVLANAVTTHAALPVTNVRLTSPDGTIYQLTVANNGTLGTTLVT